jgi:site-specific recombinase XerD
MLNMVLNIETNYVFSLSAWLMLGRSCIGIPCVQQLLGHSNLNTTQVYVQFKDEDLQEGYNKIEF